MLTKEQKQKRKEQKKFRIGGDGLIRFAKVCKEVGILPSTHKNLLRLRKAFDEKC
jgi:hypothetical protein